MSVDPVTADSVTGSNFNRYWYANNNPYKFTDPDGRQSKKDEPAKTVHQEATSAGVSAVGNTGFVFGGGQIAMQSEAAAWQAIGGTGTGPAAAGALANAKDYAGFGKAFLYAGAGVTAVAGIFELATAQDTASQGHGVFTIALGLLGTVMAPEVVLAVGGVDFVAQKAEYTNKQGETSTGWSAIMEAGGERIETQNKRDTENGPIIY